MVKGIRMLLPLIAMVVADRLPDWRFSDLLRYSAMGYILVDIVLRARSGYHRRLRHWTRESWRRYFLASAIPAGALLIFVCMQIAFAFRISLVGTAHSTTRAIWVAIELTFLLIGGVGFASAVTWLAEGDPSKQFTRFQRRHHPTPGSAA
jgi:small-conductance mechanosensitive channel